MTGDVADTLSVVLINQRIEIQRLTELVDRFVETRGLSPDEVTAIHLVLDEVVMNIIEYAYDDDRQHQIQIDLTIDRATITVRIEDDGRAFNPLDVPPPNLDLPLEERQIGGLGIFLVKSNVDTIAHRREGDRNVLFMTKKRGVE